MVQTTVFFSTRENLVLLRTLAKLSKPAKPFTFGGSGSLGGGGSSGSGCLGLSGLFLGSTASYQSQGHSQDQQQEMIFFIDFSS